MVFANSICFAVRLPLGVRRELVGQNQQAVERRPQLVRHVREELGLVLRGERELLGLLLEGLPRLLDFAVLPLDLGVLLGEQLGLFLQLLVGLLQLLLLRLQLARERLRLLQQIFGPRVRLDRVQHDADALGELIEEGLVRRLKRSNEASSITPLTWPSKRIGSTTMLIGADFARDLTRS